MVAAGYYTILQDHIAYPAHNAAVCMVLQGIRGGGCSCGTEVTWLLQQEGEQPVRLVDVTVPAFRSRR